MLILELNDVLLCIGWFCKPEHRLLGSSTEVYLPQFFVEQTVTS